MMKKLHITGLVIVIVLIAGIVIAEQMTFSTYYPAPAGRYREFSTTGKTLLATDEFGTELTNARVGIGTTSPTGHGGTRLQVNGHVAVNSGFGFFALNSTNDELLTGMDTDPDGTILFNYFDGTSWFEQMRITPQGNVGIGTTAPETSLHVETDLRTALPSRQFPLILYNTAPGGGAMTFPIGHTAGIFPANIYGIGDEGNMRIAINRTNGNVGIGTMNPGAIPEGKLVVEDYGNVTVAVSNSDPASNWAQFAALTDNNGDQIQTVLFAESGIEQGGVGTNSNHPFYIRSNGIQSMTFDTSGNVGIGTDDPGYKLHVVGTVYADDFVEYSPAFPKGLKGEEFAILSTILEDPQDPGKADHTKLHPYLQGESGGRDLSKVVQVLVACVKQLQTEVEKLQEVK